MSEPPSRPSLPTSSSAFALPPSTSASTSTAEDGGAFMFRFRRPSLLAPKASYLADAHLHSPLVSSHMPLWLRRRGQVGVGDDSESDKERMCTDSSPSNGSENPTPPLTTQGDGSAEDVGGEKVLLSHPLSTGPRRTHNTIDGQEVASRLNLRRFSQPVCPGSFMPVASR